MSLPVIVASAAKPKVNRRRGRTAAVGSRPVLVLLPLLRTTPDKVHFQTSGNKFQRLLAKGG